MGLNPPASTLHSWMPLGVWPAAGPSPIGEARVRILMPKVLVCRYHMGLPRTDALPVS